MTLELRKSETELQLAVDNEVLLRDGEKMAAELASLHAQRKALLSALARWLQHAEANPGIFKSHKSNNWTPLVVQTRAAVEQCKPR